MAEQPSVLIVEDEVPLAELFVAWLEDSYDCHTAFNGDEALARIDADIDVVLLDRRMPGLSGDDVLNEIRARGFDCPVGMVTAVEPDFDIVEMGFDGYIVKPVAVEELHGFVGDLLSLPEYDDELHRFFQLASKRAALEAAKNKSELERSDEYQLLLDELSRVRAEVDDRRDTLETCERFSRLL